MGFMFCTFALLLIFISNHTLIFIPVILFTHSILQISYNYITSFSINVPMFLLGFSFPPRTHSPFKPHKLTKDPPNRPNNLPRPQIPNPSRHPNNNPPPPRPRRDQRLLSPHSRRCRNRRSKRLASRYIFRSGT